VLLISSEAGGALLIFPRSSTEIMDPYNVAPPAISMLIAESLTASSL
jgi:hypothetical protein